MSRHFKLRDFGQGVVLSGHDTWDGYVRRMSKQGIIFNGWAEAAMEPLRSRSGRERLAIVIRSPIEIGLTGVSSFPTICEAASEFGLKTCPIWVGPAMRVAYLDQESGEQLVLAMDPVNVWQDGFAVFGLSHINGALSLHDIDVHRERAFEEYAKFVFSV